MSIVLQSSGGGQITLQEPTTASNFTQTLPAAGGVTMVSGNMPAFSAYLTSSQTLSSLTLTKLQFNVEEFDTNSNYDNATNYRFTPTVAGYYQISLSAGVATTGSSVANTQLTVNIFKNGSSFKFGGQTLLNNTYDMQAIVSSLIYFNGSTDYVEGYIRQISGGSLGSTAAQSTAWFQGVLVRAA